MMKKQDLVKLIREVISEVDHQMLNENTRHQVIVRNYSDGSDKPEAWARDIDGTVFDNLKKMLSNRITRILSQKEALTLFAAMKNSEEIFTKPFYEFNLQSNGNDFLAVSRKDDTGKIEESSRDKMTMEELRESIRTEIKRQLNLTK